MNISVETITPEIAAEMLKRNKGNRKIRDGKVEMISAALLRGEWVMNAEAIKITPEGDLIDGQHRLMAVVKSGVTIHSVVARGVPFDAQMSMDQGTARTFTDILTWKGEKYAARLASTTRVLYHFFESGYVTTQNHSGGYTRNQLLDFIERNPEIRDCMQPPEYKLNDRLLTPAISSALLFIFASIDNTDAHQFFYLLGSGDGLAKGDPIFGLRSNLEQNMMRKHAQVNTRHRSALAIKAWNYWRAGETVDRIRWAAGGSLPEKYPLVDGYTYTYEDDPPEEESQDE